MVVADENNLGGLSQAEYDRRLAEFEATINRGEKIEPADWMPDAYRQQLIRLIHVHANSEICGALREGESAWGGGATASHSGRPRCASCASR